VSNIPAEGSWIVDSVRWNIVERRAAGENVRAIAESLRVSEKTVKRIMENYRAHSGVWSARHGQRVRRALVIQPEARGRFTGAHLPKPRGIP
jgi:hypothetical protein